MTKKDILNILKDEPDDAELLIALCPSVNRISAYSFVSNIVEKDASPLTPTAHIPKKNVVLYMIGDMNQLIKEQDKNYDGQFK